MKKWVLKLHLPHLPESDFNLHAVEKHPHNALFFVTTQGLKNRFVQYFKSHIILSAFYWLHIKGKVVRLLLGGCWKYNTIVTHFVTMHRKTHTKRLRSFDRRMPIKTEYWSLERLPESFEMQLNCASDNGICFCSTPAEWLPAASSKAPSRFVLVSSLVAYLLGLQETRKLHCGSKDVDHSGTELQVKWSANDNHLQTVTIRCWICALNQCSVLQIHCPASFPCFL